MSSLVERVVPLVERVVAALIEVVPVEVGPVGRLRPVGIEGVFDDPTDGRDGLVLAVTLDDFAVVAVLVDRPLDADEQRLVVAQHMLVDTDAAVPDVHEEADVDGRWVERVARPEAIGAATWAPVGLTDGVNLAPGDAVELIRPQFLGVDEGRPVRSSALLVGPDGGCRLELLADDSLEECVGVRVDVGLHGVAPCEVGTVARTSSKEHTLVFRYGREGWGRSPTLVAPVPEWCNGTSCPTSLGRLEGRDEVYNSISIIKSQ